MFACTVALQVKFLNTILEGALSRETQAIKDVAAAKSDADREAAEARRVVADRDVNRATSELLRETWGG